MFSKLIVSMRSIKILLDFAIRVGSGVTCVRANGSITKISNQRTQLLNDELSYGK